MEFYQITSLILLITYVLFLFGSIKLKNKQPSTGHRILFLAFTILTITSLSQFAQRLGIITIDYHPQYEIDAYWYNLNRWKPLHKWFYWTRHLLEIAGHLLASIGFIICARTIYQSIKLRFA